MIKTIINFLFRKRFKSLKILKSKKGFSLLEVLVGVTIIGIITAIAVPRFTNYRDTAALTAASSTGQNVAKAYNLCTATKSNCASLTDLNIACETCGTPVDGSTAFCVPMTQTISGKAFRACVHINKSNGAIAQQYGGEFKFCHKKCKLTTPANCTNVGDVVVNTTIKKCDNDSDCPNGDGTNFETAPSCKANTSSTAGTCTSGTGLCQST